MSDQSYGLRFDIYERVHLSAEEVGIDELEEIELYPRIQVVSGDDYATLRGHLLLTGLYRGNGETRELSHLIPVEITVPLNRVNRLEDISVEIENFDVDLLNERSLNVTGVLSLQGIETAAFAPAAQDWNSREYTASYVPGQDFNPQNDPWIQADASFLQQEVQPEAQADREQPVFTEGDAVQQEETFFAAQAGQLQEEERAEASFDSLWSIAAQEGHDRFGQDEAEAADSGLNSFQPAVPAVEFRDQTEHLPNISFAALANPELQASRTANQASLAENQASRTESQEAQQDTFNSFEDNSSESAVYADSAAGGAVPRDPAEVQVWHIETPDVESAAQDVFAGKAYSDVQQEALTDESRLEERVSAAEEEAQADSLTAEQVNPEDNTVLEEALEAEAAQAEEDKPQELKIALGSKNKTVPDSSEPFGFSQLLHSSKPAAVAEEVRIQEPDAASAEALQAEREEQQWKQAFISSLNEATPFRKVRMVIVQREETIAEIADRYSISASELLLHNRLSEQNIAEGQVLYLP